MKRVVLATAALVAAVAVFTGLSLPPRQLRLPERDDGSVAGALHIHTNRSDGRSSPQEIAEAAARAGLAFIVLTDHGDGTRAPDAPIYRAGVLCIDAVEISTDDGHYLALGLQPSPFPLEGEARDVVEDVALLGGWGVVAHPDSPKDDLRWGEWRVPFDGIEILNLDASWRRHAVDGRWGSKLALLQGLLSYPFRAPETIGSLARSDPGIVNQWGSLTSSRRVVAVAGTDAHAKLALMDVDPGDNAMTLPFPGYEPALRALSVHVKPSAPLTGDAAADSAAILAGLRAGHAFVAIDGIATPPAFEFSASNLAGTAQQGDELEDNGLVTLRIRSNAPAPFTTAIFRNNTVLGAGHREADFAVTAPAGPAVYRVEIRATDRSHAPVWLLGNPIYVRGPRPAAEETIAPVVATETLFDGRDMRRWRVEQSSAAIRVTSEGELEFRYGVDGDARAVALVASVPEGLAAFDRVTFTVSADRPMRLSVQLRTNTPGVPEDRWRRSVFVDQTPRTYTLFFREFRPVGETRAPLPVLSRINDVLFVAAPVDVRRGGASAVENEFRRVWIASAALQR